MTSLMRFPSAVSRDPAKFTAVVSGRTGVGGVYDLWRRVKAWVRGERFDPQRHEAIALVPVTDPAQDGQVIDVMREGYLIGDEVLRPAAVAVGKLR